MAENSRNLRLEGGLGVLISHLLQAGLHHQASSPNPVSSVYRIPITSSPSTLYSAQAESHGDVLINFLGAAPGGCVPGNINTKQAREL